MNWKSFQNLIMTLPNAAPASGGKFVNCRCKECFDSLDPRSKHMYVRIPWDNDDLPWYYCHKCNCHGIVDQKKLIEWGIYDKNVALELIEYIKNYRGKRNTRSNNTNVRYIRNSYIRNDEMSEFKRQYICNRLGLDLSYKDLIDLKIVLNLLDFLRENNIREYTRSFSILKDLDRVFLGFLSIDNGSINMRRTVDKGQVYESIDKRYVNYIIDNDQEYNRFYTIPTRVDLMKNSRTKLHIAEGPVDILSIYLNLRNKEEGIYTSIAGSNYIPVMFHFMRNLRVPNIELHFYPDNGKEGNQAAMRKVINVLPDKSIPWFIHRNRFPGEKDFGVPKSRIDEYITSKVY